MVNLKKENKKHHSTLFTPYCHDDESTIIVLYYTVVRKNILLNLSQKQLHLSIDLNLKSPYLLYFAFSGLV